MPLKIKKQGSKFLVVEPSGKRLGTHSSREKARNQIIAIEISKKRRGK